MPNLIHGQDPGGGLRPVQVDDNGNLSVDLVSGVSVSTTIASGTLIETRQVSGSADSVVVNSFDTSILANQVSGSAWSVASIANSGVDIGDVDVTSVLPGTAAGSLGKAEDAAHASGDTGVAVWAVANEANTARAADSDYLPIASDTEGNVRTVGNRDSDAVDAGEPVKIGGQARTTNPVAVADADRVNFTADDLGRQVMTPYQVRDLVSTAFLALTGGAETALIAGVASTFLDVVHVICANQSDAAVDLDFRTGTAGSIMFSLTVPADATAGFVPIVPIPQTEAAQAWTVDMADISGTTVNISALFIRNI